MADMLLHIYGQGAWHDVVEIVGNREALEELMETINKALCSQPHSMEVFINDGEGYIITVRLLEGNWDTPLWRKLAVPYTNDYAAERRDDAVYPYQIK